MGILSRIRQRLQRSENQADTSEELSKVSVQCPKCRHIFKRKPSKVEKLAGMAGDISTKELLYIYKNRCNACDVRFKAITEATIDHIIPKYRGGVNGLHNYQLLCKPCNLKKGHKWEPLDRGDVIQLRHLVEVTDLQPHGRGLIEKHEHVQKRLNEPYAPKEANK